MIQDIKDNLKKKLAMILFSIIIRNRHLLRFPMKKLITVVNDLEGSGKTSLASVLKHTYTEAGYDALLVTTDDADVDEQFEGDFWDFDDVDLPVMIGALDNHEVVILDVASGSARNWAEICEEHELDTVLSEIDAEMTVVLPVHPSERNLNEVVDLLEIFADSADYVIANLPIEARRSVEVPWKGSQAAKACKYLGASEMTIPGISSELSTALSSHDLTLAQALRQLDNLPRFVEVEVMQWREAAQEIVASEEAYLFPEPAGATLSY